MDGLQGACESSGIVGKISSVPVFSRREIRVLAVGFIKKIYAPLRFTHSDMPL